MRSSTNYSDYYLEQKRIYGIGLGQIDNFDFLFNKWELISIYAAQTLDLGFAQNNLCF